MEVVSTENAPGAIGPYSQAVKANGMVFCSGQIPIDPATGNFVSDDISEQTDQICKNLSEVLKAAGSGLSKVVKTTVFLADMNDFAAMNEVYGKYFDTNKPARATVQAAGLPRDSAGRDRVHCIGVGLEFRLLGGSASYSWNSEHRKAKRLIFRTFGN